MRPWEPLKTLKQYRILEFATMFLASRLPATIALLVFACFSRSAVANVITYVAPTDPVNSNATWPAVNGTYTQNFGIAFTTGSSGPFGIDWISLKLNTSGQTVGNASLKVALHNTNNSTAYSAVAGSTAYATDTVNFTMPTTTSTYFDLNLTASDLQNISNFDLQANTSYALILYSPSVNIGIGRHTGYTNGTTNDYYTVTNGFTMLDTFRNNVANYTNTTNSYPSLAISFGANGASSVPEPATIVLGALASGAIGLASRRRRNKQGNSLPNAEADLS